MQKQCFMAPAASLDIEHLRHMRTQAAEEASPKAKSPMFNQRCEL